MAETKKDSLTNGWGIGLICLGIGYAIMRLVEVDSLPEGILKKVFTTPNPQLIFLTINILLFRFLMVKWDRQETGKGLLLCLFIEVLLYLTNQKYHFIPG